MADIKAVYVHSFIPLALRLEDKRILMIGGGRVATGKLETLQDYSFGSLRVVATQFCDKFLAIKKGDVECLKKVFEESDLEETDVVIVAVEDRDLQREIYGMCKRRRILCNCVDLLDCCDFIFSAIIKRGHFTLAINSNGLFPGFSLVFKNYMERFIPLDLEAKLKEFIVIRSSMVPGLARMRFITNKAREYVQQLEQRDEVL